MENFKIPYYLSYKTNSYEKLMIQSDQTEFVLRNYISEP